MSKNAEKKKFLTLEADGQTTEEKPLLYFF